MPISSGPPISTVRLSGATPAMRARRAATSSDATGWISAVGSLIVWPLAPDWAMAAANSKNWVARRIV